MCPRAERTLPLPSHAGHRVVALETTPTGALDTSPADHRHTELASATA
jgi:hypothetical protein